MTDSTNIPDVSPTLGEGGRRLWIYPDRRPGSMARLRRSIAMCLMGIYLVLPWLSWQGQPLLRIDIRAGHVHAFGGFFRFTEPGFIALALVALALTLFFVTAWMGRLWCGLACPQTVFVEWLIRPIEEFFEGNAHKRRRQDAGPMTWQLRWRKFGKHASFMVVAAVVANAFLAYFIPPEQVLAWMTESPVKHPVAFAVMLVVMLAFYFDLGWFREQFCAFLCPYARFQSVMIDRKTPVVAYDGRRGEPRGKKAAGDCIDCGLCQRVCPTGIDIRDGLQMECISCYRCVDACNMVMTSLQRPLGLIRSASAEELEGSSRKVSLRVFAYGFGLILLTGIFAWQMHTRPAVKVSFQRQPGAAFSRLADGRISNTFVMRTAHNATGHAALDFAVVSPPGASIVCGSCEQGLGPFEERKHALVLIFNDAVAPTAELKHQTSGIVYSLPILAP